MLQEGFAFEKIRDITKFNPCHLAYIDGSLTYEMMRAFKLGWQK